MNWRMALRFFRTAAWLIAVCVGFRSCERSIQRYSVSKANAAYSKSVEAAIYYWRTK